MIVSQVLDELGISLDQELSGITPGLERPHISTDTVSDLLILFSPLFLSLSPLLPLLLLTLLLSLFFQTKKKAVAGAETDDLQARLDDLRRGDDD